MGIFIGGRADYDMLFTKLFPSRDQKYKKYSSMLVLTTNCFWEAWQLLKTMSTKQTKWLTM